MADNENVIGLAMQLDVSNIKEGVKEVNKIIKSSKDEFNNATAGMDMWSKSSEGLNAKLGQLGKQLSAQQKLAAGYEAEIERVKNQEGDHTEELARLNEKLQKAQNEIKKTQSQMNHYGESLVEVQREEKDANSALGKLTDTISKQKKELNNLTKDYKSTVLQYGKNSREAKNLAKKIKQLSGEIEDNEEQVEEAENAYDKLNKKITEVGAKAVEKANKGFKKLGAAVTGAVAGFLATAEATREFRTNMGKVNTAFTDSGKSAKQAEDTYKKFYGILGDEGQATEAVSHLAKLANSQEDLTKWTNIAAGVYGTFGDSLPIESLTEAANETAKTGEVTGSLADALNWAGVNQDSFQKSLDGCNSEQERNALITKTLNGLYGEASKKYKENNKDIIASQEAQAELSKAMADIGAQAEPVMTQVKLMGVQILKALLPVIEKLIPAIKANLPQIAVAVSGLLSVILAMNAAMYINKAITTAVTTAQFIATAATKAQAAAQWLLNAAMNANPITLVVIAIMALVAAFVVLWKKSDAFRNFWIGLWEDIKKYAKIAVDAIAKFFSSAWDGIKKAWSATGQFFKNIWDGIKKVFNGVKDWFSSKFKAAWDGIKKAFGSVKKFFTDKYNEVKAAFKAIPETLKAFFTKAWDKIKTAFSKVGDFFGKVFLTISAVFTAIPETLKAFFTKAWDKIKSAFSKVGDFFSGVKDDVVNAFKELPDKMKSVGKNLVEGLWNGINNAKDWIIGKIKGFTDGVLGGIKDFFGVHSPSTETAEIGGYMAEGLALGMEDGVKENQNIFQKIFGFLKDLLGDAGTAVINQISKLLGIDFSAGFADGFSDGLTDEIPVFTDSIESAIMTAGNQANVTIEPEIEIDTRKSWQKWLDDMEDTLGLSEDKLQEWANNTGKYVQKVYKYLDYVVDKLHEFVDTIAESFNQMIDQQIDQLDTEIDKLNESKDTEVQAAQDSANEQLKILNKMYDDEKISAEEYRKRKKQIDTAVAKFTQQKNQETQDQEKALLKKKNQLAKKQFEAQKATAIASTLIQSGLAVIKGFAELGPIGGAINAAVLGTLTTAQIIAMAAQQYVPMLAKGGVADGATLAMIGEAGKEAVIPLERNTGWMETLAEKLASIMEKDFLEDVRSGSPAFAMAGNGQTIVNNYYNQTINSPKSLTRREIYRDSKNLLALKG